MSDTEFIKAIFDIVMGKDNKPIITIEQFKNIVDEFNKE